MRGRCSLCDGELIAKCGPLVAWHWAHRAADCDPWAEPETAWHLGWKELLAWNGADIEVVMGSVHRADAVMPDGCVVELQSAYLDSREIAEREEFYGPSMCWVYRCTWADRIHWGKSGYGFWWKNGSKAMTHHRMPVFWDVDGALFKVSLNLMQRTNSYGELVSERVLGKAQRVDPGSPQRSLFHSAGEWRA